MKELVYTNKILAHPKYLEYINRITLLEQDRVFCKHDLDHFLNVARIAYIINLEHGLNIDKDIIYSTALLHDIGKWKQYEEGTKHQIVSAYLCEEILQQVGIDNKNIELIKEAILNHGNRTRRYENNLVGVLYQADKLSRNCFQCKANQQCKWDKELKNNFIKV